MSSSSLRALLDASDPCVDHNPVKPSTLAAVLTLSLFAPVALLPSRATTPAPPALVNGYQPTWWKEAVV